MKKSHMFLAITAVIVAGVVASVLLHPLRISESRIRERLLKDTPLGTPATQVLTVVQNQFSSTVQKPPQYNSKWGATKEILHPKNSGYIGSRNVNVIVGARSINDVLMGSYWPTPPLPVITYVYASWAFDDNDKLIDIIVDKETDGP